MTHIITTHGGTVLTRTTTTTLYTSIESPIGDLLVSGERTDAGTAITRLHTVGHNCRPTADWVRDDSMFGEIRRQLAEYFRGTRHAFDLPLRAPGTAFQRAVWAQLQRIEYGVTASYGQVAQAIGAPTASRAVGGANGRNPISIIVPCHRVIGSNSKLTGYAGGLTAKQWLLDHERRQLGIILPDHP